MFERIREAISNSQAAYRRRGVFFIAVNTLWISVNAIAMLLISRAAFHKGLELRRWTWNYTEGAHLRASLDNAISWAHYANQKGVGIVDVYPRLVQLNGEDGTDGRFHGPGDMPLDYPPLRLLIMSRWEAWTEKHLLKNERAGHWYPRYEFTEPMLKFNTGCELFGAVMMFVLVYYWLRKCRGIRWPWDQPVRGAWPAMFSALLVWFSPASIFNAHGYVQWDVWLLGPFLLAIFLALLDQWLLAGICIGVVCLCKGQILLVLPALVVWQLCTLRRSALLPMLLSGGAVLSLWMCDVHLFPLKWLYVGSAILLAPPLFYLLYPWTRTKLSIGIAIVAVFVALMIGSWRYIEADMGVEILGSIVLIAWLIFSRQSASILRFAIGMMLAIACVASPWMVSNDASFSWLAAVLIALQLMLSLFFFRRWSKIAIVLHLVAVAAGFELVLWPWTKTVAPEYFWLAFGAIAAIAIVARLLPRRFAPAWFCAAATAAIFACVPLFHTSMDWYTVGIKASTNQHPNLQWCKPTNLGALLEEEYHWQFKDEINLADYLPFLQERWDVPMRYLMIGAYLLCAALSGIGMAVQHRRRSPAFFFAMVAPWILMFTLLPQMQARYLLWGAVFSAATASFSVEGLLLYLLLAAISVADTAVFMFQTSREPSKFVETWRPLLNPIFPGLAWGVLLLAGIWVCLAVKPGQRLPALTNY